MRDQEKLTMQIAFSIANSSGKMLGVGLEPWAEFYELGQGTFDVASLSPDGQTLTISFGPQGELVIWAESGDVAGIFQEGVELHGRNIESEMPVPGVPPGMDSRTFLETMFDGSDEKA